MGDPVRQAWTRTIQGCHATCKLLDILDGSWGIHSHNDIDLLWISLDSSVADDESE